jgi:signal transduction histidine kinase
MEHDAEAPGRRILVVDDEDANVRLLERMLAASGFEQVRTTTDPRTVEDEIRTWMPDLILLDLLMPYLDGFEVMRLVRDMLGPEAFLPILVITADATEETKRRALAAGANDFVTKPFDGLEVTLRMRNLLHTRALHLRLQEKSKGLETTVVERTNELEATLDALRATDASRRRLLSRLIAAQEQERTRIAHDIHDDSIQVMTAAGMRLALLRSQLAATEDTENLKRLEETVQEAIARLRRLLFELRPPALDRDGLAAAIGEQLQRTAREAEWSVDLSNELSTEPPEESRLVLYRIAQEAITNARKHARASHVHVRLGQADGGYSLRIVDDGRGFDPSSGTPEGHLGVLGMKERAELAQGWLRVSSGPGGTTVEAWLPDHAPV